MIAVALRPKLLVDERQRWIPHTNQGFGGCTHRVTIFEMREHIAQQVDVH